MRQNAVLFSAGALALGLFSAQAAAVDISIGGVSMETNGAVDGASDHKVWEENETAALWDPLIDMGQQPPPYDPYLDDNASDPSSNIELSTLDEVADIGDWLAGAVDPTVLSGTFGGSSPISFSSLTIGDWSANGNALAADYVAGFLDTWLGVTLDAADLALVAQAFVYGVPGGVNSPAFFASDPNLSYAYKASDKLKVTFALAGLLDATSFFQPFFDPFGVTLPDGVQASEVVKVTYKGSTSYEYGFFATPSYVYAQDCPLPPGDPACSYPGNYELSVPEPATLALLGLGVAGIGWSSRKRRMR